MGGRYLITGVQLGILQHENKSIREEIITSILNNQYVWESEKPIEKDVEKLRIVKEI